MTEEKPARHTARPLRLAGRLIRRTWQGLIIGLLAVALGVAAFLSPGLVEADVRLDEGNIYAINRNSELVGTINSQIRQLSNATSIGDLRSEVLQSGETVLLFLPQSSSLVPLDAGRNITGSATQLPLNAGVQLVGDKLLIYRPESGAVWFGEPNSLLTLDFEKEKPDFEIGEGGVATLTTSGSVIGLDPGRSRLVRVVDGQQSTVALPFELKVDSPVSLSAVGESAVVLDHASSRIWVEGMDKAFSVSEAGSAQLMAPAPDALSGEHGARAVFANEAGLNRVTPDGLESLSGRIDLGPIAPVQVGDCVYGAGISGDQGSFVKVCEGAEPVVKPIESIGTDGTAIEFQVNRGVVVLNDQADGTVWMVDKDMFMIRPEDWAGVMPEEQRDDAPSETNDTNQSPDRTQDNRNPIAKPDVLAARAGTSTILTVLDNDTDPDGDILTITTSNELDGATLQPINNGAGLQISISGDTTAGEYSFSYRVDDGRLGSATTTATVTVLPADRTINKAPVMAERPGGHKPLPVKLGSEISKRVLLDWRDPDGDPLMLKDASLAGDSGDIVSFTPDGTIHFIDVGKTTGLKTINVVVSDGVKDTSGELVLDVVEDSVAPIAFGDFVTTNVNTPVRVEPLANDQVSRPTLSEVTQPEDCAECVLEPNYREKNFIFTAPKAGIYYVGYTIIDGQTASGVVRIDVRGEEADGVPVAAQDVALLPADGTVTLDPLLNDTDPDGDVLVVTTYDAPESLEVVMERRHVMTIRARHELKTPVQFTYYVSDGRSPVEGKIIVVPTTGGSQQPTAVDDDLRVRAGTTGTVTPLENDSSPVGLQLSLDKLGDSPLGDRVWIDGDRVRVSIADNAPAGVTTVPYTVADSRGNVSPGYIRIEVVSQDATNVAPLPEPVVDRVLAGTETRIAVPLGGLDPNGDAVRLVGITSGPQLGRITTVGEEYLTYEAFPDKLGTDTFTYEVADAQGARGFGEARIGVAPVSVTNAKPVAVQDRIVVRPNRPVRISALENDFDADGDNFGYAEGAAIEADEGITAEIQDREIVLTAPSEPGIYTGTYSIQDVRGEQAYGQFIVEVAEDAPLLAPVARDDSVSISALIGQKFVEVGVLENDYDPDGPKEELRIEVDEPAEGEAPEEALRINEAGDRLIVAVKPQMQQIAYRVVDGDGNATNGLVTVPGVADIVPVLKNPGIELTPTAGQPFMLDINEYVTGTGGRAVRLIDADHIWPTYGEAKISGPAKIEYVADVSHKGAASIVFEVRDEVPADSEEAGRTSVITIAFDVAPAAQSDTGTEEGPAVVAPEPPRMVVTDPRLLVGAGEGPRTLNLLSLFRDPDGDSGSMVLKGDLRPVSGDADVSISRNGETLTAEAPVKAKSGSVKVLAGTIVDADGIEVDFQVTVEVTQSTRPVVSTTDDVIEKATAGSSVPIAVTANDRSNLLDDTTVTLIDAASTSPGGTVTADPSSGSVTVKLDPAWSGLFTGRYTVNDATGDPARQTTGQIRVNVVDKPGRPTTPYSGIANDGTVTVQYRQLNGTGGAPLISATAVASSPGQADRSGPCAALTCTVTGLTNGLPWTVKVQEINEVGASEFSDASAPLVPDTEPNKPGEPSVAFGNGELKLAWNHDPVYSSPNGGSPLTGYQVRITGGKSELSAVLPPNVREYTWTGLTNGTTYMFEVEATNATGKKSGFSPASKPEFPSAPPSGNTAPAQSVIEDDIGGGFTVTFNPTALNNGGANITGYKVIPITQGGGPQEGLAVLVNAGTGVHSTIVRGMGLKPTKFEIMATNRSGTAAVGQTPVFEIAYPEAKVSAVTATVGDRSITAAVTSNVEGTPARYQYSVGGGSWKELGGPTGKISGLTNGETYSVAFRVELNGRYSNEYSKSNLMPRSDSPPSPTALSPILELPDIVWYTYDDSIVTNQGWPLSGYEFCARKSGNCNSFSSDLPLKLTAGETFRIYYRNGGASGNFNRGMESVSEPKLNGNEVSFSFPYVNSGSCTITGYDEDGKAGEAREVSSSDRKLAVNGLTLPEVPIDTPPSGGPTTKPVKTAKVVCNANGYGSQTWNLD